MPYHTNMTSGRYAYVGGPPKPKRNPADFDTCSASVIYRGTRAAFDAHFPAGSATSGLSATLFLTEVEIKNEASGHIEADLQWKGFYFGSKDMIFSHSISARDTQWPQENGGVTIYVPGTWIGKSTNTNPATAQYYRVRLTDQIAGVSVKGWSKAGILTPPPPPVIAGAGASQTIGGKPVRPINRPQSFAGLLDPMYNYPRGWTLRNYEPGEAIPLSGGDAGQGLYFWTATYDWNADYGP